MTPALKMSFAYTKSKVRFAPKMRHAILLRRSLQPASRLFKFEMVQSVRYSTFVQCLKICWNKAEPCRPLLSRQIASVDLE